MFLFQTANTLTYPIVPNFPDPPSPGDPVYPPIYPVIPVALNPPAPIIINPYPIVPHYSFTPPSLPPLLPNQPPLSSPKQQSKLSTSAIIGIAVSASVVTLSVSVGTYIWLRYRL